LKKKNIWCHVDIFFLGGWPHPLKPLFLCCDSEERKPKIKTENGKRKRKRKKWN
jgi:hypothetical protein